MKDKEVVIIHRLSADQVQSIREDEERHTILRERYRMVKLLMERYRESQQDALEIVGLSEEEYSHMSELIK